MIFGLLIQDMTTVPRPDKFKVLTEWRTLVGRVVNPPAKATLGLCKVLQSQENVMVGFVSFRIVVPDFNMSILGQIMYVWLYDPQASR